MTTLVIPCMGRKLFLGLPQWISEFPSGETLLENGLNNINLDIYDKIVVVIFKKDLTLPKSVEITKRIERNYPKLIFCCLDTITQGPAETVYKAINRLKIRGKLIVKDVDAIFKFDFSSYENFIAGINITKYDSDVYNLLQKSFLVLNEQHQILDVIEKNIKSEFISMGMYGFHDVSMFKKAFEQLSDKTYPIDKIYISHIISYLIGRYGEVFSYCELKYFYSYDSEHDWIKMLKKYETYIIDLEKCELDIQGDLLIEKLKKMKKNNLNVILIIPKNISNNINKEVMNIFPIIYKNNIFPINLIDSFEKFNLMLPEVD